MLWIFETYGYTQVIEYVQKNFIKMRQIAIQNVSNESITLKQLLEMTEGGNPSEVIIDFGDGAMITYQVEEESFIKRFVRGIFGNKKKK